MVTSSGKINRRLDQGRLQESLAMAFNRLLWQQVQYRCFILFYKVNFHHHTQFMKLETSETSNNLTTHGRRTRRLLAPPVTGFIRQKNYFWLLADLGGDERRKKGRNTLMMKEPASLQEEQCNGQGHASIVENADFMSVLEGGDGGSVQNTNIISDQGNAEHGSPRSGDGEDSKVQATSSDIGDDPVGPLPRRWMSRNCQIAFRRKALNGRFLPKNHLPYNQRAKHRGRGGLGRENLLPLRSIWTGTRGRREQRRRP